MIAARWLLLGCLAAVTACKSAPYDYGPYLAHMPRSILVLPPINDSIEVRASNAFLATVTAPLAERGYYVFPVAVVESYLRQNGRPTPADMHAIEPAKLREVFGADAALYIAIQEWGSSYQVVTSSAKVVADYRLVDLQTNTVLWNGRAAAVANSGGGNLVGMLASAIVSQVANSVSDPCPALACQANAGLFHDDHHGLLLGWRHPGHEQDQVARRAAAAAAAAAHSD